jgi:hypothetical protein
MQKDEDEPFKRLKTTCEILGGLCPHPPTAQNRMKTTLQDVMERVKIDAVSYAAACRGSTLARLVQSELDLKAEREALDMAGGELMAAGFSNSVKGPDGYVERVETGGVYKLELVGRYALRVHWSRKAVTTVVWRNIAYLEWKMPSHEEKGQAPGLRVLVTGGRNYGGVGHPSQLDAVLDELHSRQRIGAVLHGGATGADALAKRWAWENRVQEEEYPADWNGLGLKAGPLRNQEMIDTAPDLVIAFPGGKGTADCLERAYKANIPVNIIGK